MNTPFNTPWNSLPIKVNHFSALDIKDWLPLSTTGIQTKIGSIIEYHDPQPAEPQAEDGPAGQSAEPTPSPTAMPIHLFPPALREIVETLQASLGYCPDYTAASMLFTASIAIGNSYQASIMEGWQASAVLFVALVGEPGVGKTHPLNAMVAPLRQRDLQTYQQYKQAKEHYTANEKAPKGERISNLEQPVWPKFILSDCTPEALAQKHQDNPRGLGYCVDELAGWIKNFNRYTKGSEQEMWLSIWNAVPINIDRKTSTPCHISRPFVSVGGTIQPAVLEHIAREERDNNGFVDRILFVFPPDQERRYWSETQLDPKVLDRWTKIVEELLRHSPATDENGQVMPEVLRFLPEAKELLMEWQRANTDRCNEDESYAGIGAKIEQYTLRLALIMQCLYSASEGTPLPAIGVPATQAALGLVDYFAGQAIKVRDAISGADPVGLLTTKVREYYTALPPTFTTAEAVLLGAYHGLSESTVKRFLRDRSKGKKYKLLLSTIGHGQYSKLF